MTLEDDVRQLVIDGEHAAREARYPLKQKAALQPQYELYLKFLSRSQQPKVPRADDYLRVVAAMRDEQTFADLDFLNGSELPSVEHIAGSPLRILAAYLERLEGTIVFIIERGAGVLTLFALRSEGSSLEERVALERASKTCVDALIGLMRLQDDNIRRIGRREQISKAFFEPIEQAAAQVWDAMPASIRDAITDARSVLYLPSTFGDLNTFPLELIRTKEGWLGITRSIARLSSLRTLLELLSPNRSPSKLDAKAVVVRAADSKELTNADAEATSVYRQLKDLGFETEIDREPRVATLRSALDRGLRVMHYCGHGYAGKLGELLPLAENEMLGPHDFSQLSGWGTPFVYLSTCEVGRARMTTTGNAIGVAIRLIEKGAPAVIACLETVPDMIAHSMAVSFYKTAMKLPLGEALVAARKEHLKFPPVCWGAFSYFGDPDLQLITVDGVVPQTRRQTLRWDTLVGRHLAIRSSESRQRVLDAIAIARTSCVGDKDTLLKQVVSWVEKSFRAEDPMAKEERLELCRAVAEQDAVAGCELRMLLAMESLRGSYYGKRKPDLIVDPDAIIIGLYCAKAVHDMLAWAAFAIESSRSVDVIYEPTMELRMLKEAEGILDCWRLEEPATTAMLSEVQELKSNLQVTHRG